MANKKDELMDYQLPGSHKRYLSELDPFPPASLRPCGKNHSLHSPHSSAPARYVPSCRSLLSARLRLRTANNAIKTTVIKRRNNLKDETDEMSYYTDMSQLGGPSPRQAPVPNQNHTNGINGNAVGLPGMMSAGLPTPAGHQQDLNHIHNLLEDYARIMEENRLATARILEATGRVRQLAIDHDMTNDELVAAVTKEIGEANRNMDVEISQLQKKLETARYEGKEYLDLCYKYAKSLGNMLEQLHSYRLKTIEDMCAWHRCYRQQLEIERRENLRLRNVIADMQASALRGQTALRNFTREWNGTPAHFETLAENVKLRQLCRSWKRVALPEFPDDDSEFSDDDDLIDPEEKKRVANESIARARAKLAAKQAAAADEAAVVAGMADARLE